jgi:hypothetical protein
VGQRKEELMAAAIEVVELHVVFQGLKWKVHLPYMIVGIFGS